MRRGEKCFCCDVCDCNTSCCFGFRIPLAVGYVLSCLWLLLNGIAFPAMSLLFWPRSYVFYSSCFICLVTVAMSLVGLFNAFFKNRKLFETVLYGTGGTYLLGAFILTLTLNLDVDGNSMLLKKSLEKVFNVSLIPKHSFGILQSIQILFYFYLFIAYIYCGFVLQLYDLKIRYEKGGRPKLKNPFKLNSRI